MRRLTILGCLAVGLAVGLAACGDDDDGGGGGDEVALADFGNEMASAACNKAFDCCSEAERTEIGMTYDSAAACTSQTAGFLNMATAFMSASVAAGRASYDAGAAGCLIDLMANLDCSQYGSDTMTMESTGCDAYLTPLVNQGGACTQDYECTTGNCVIPENAEEGACEAMPGSGQQCDDECAEGYYCDSFGTGTCTATKANGATCTLSEECQSDECLGDGTCGASVAICGG